MKAVPDPAVLRAVVSVVAGVLNVSEGGIEAITDLYSMSGYDSLAVVTILAELEDRLGTQVPPERLAMHAFATAKGIAVLFDQHSPAGDAV